MWIFIGRPPTGKVLAVGGFEMYFPQSGVWNLTGSLAQGLSTILHAVTLLRTGQVMVAGGSASNSTLSSAERFSSPIP